MEIYKKEWGDPEDPDGTVIDADVLADGSIRISGTDYGKSARNFSGNEENFFSRINVCYPSLSCRSLNHLSLLPDRPRVFRAG